MPSRIPSFAARVAAWQRRHGRRDLPWQGTRDPYRLWVSEIMLQQTQVATAIPYYTRFLARFPDVAALAGAEDDEVLRHWSGLGYYARARNLHRAAQAVLRDHGGRFPLEVDGLQALPGVGRSTAAAIAAFATGRPHAILDGNVKRVLARHAGLGEPVDSAAGSSRLWALAESRLPARGVEAYTQGLMDLGATVCTRARPACERCPVAADCVARLTGRTAELPLRRARRIPDRRDAMLLAIVSGDEVLVQKRPPAGIWGGLWSLPEAPADADPARWVRRQWGLRVRAVEALEPFSHAFTHFTLDARPWLVRASGEPRDGGATRVAWLPLSEAAEAALPAPVKRLLSGLRGAPIARASARAGSGPGSKAGPRRR